MQDFCFLNISRAIKTFFKRKTLCSVYKEKTPSIYHGRRPESFETRRFSITGMESDGGASDVVSVFSQPRPVAVDRNRFSGCEYLEPRGEYLYYDPVSKRFVTMDGDQTKTTFEMWSRVERNAKGYLSMERCLHSDFMGAVSKRMRAVEKTNRNGKKRLGEGPSLHFVSLGKTAAVGPYLSYCTHICDAINALTSVPLNCGVQTEDTKLEIVDDKYIRHVRGRDTVRLKTRKRDRDEVADALLHLWNSGDINEGSLKKDMTKLNFCEVYVRMFPVVDKTDTNNRAVIRVISMCAAPGFDLIQLIKLVTDESVNATGRFKFKTATAERASMWHQMVATEIDNMKVATFQQSGDLLNQKTLLYDEYTHRELHPYHMLSSLSIVKRATALLVGENYLREGTLDDLVIPGLAMVLCEDKQERERRTALYIGACEIESENIEDWVRAHQACSEFRETQMKAAKKKKDKNAAEDVSEDVQIEEIRNLVFHLPILLKPNIAPDFSDQEVEEMIEEMEEEEQSPLTYYDGEWESDLTLEVMLPAVGSELQSTHTDTLSVPVGDIRLPGNVRAILLDFFNCNVEGTGTDPEMLWNFLPGRDRLPISLPLYLKRYWLSHEHILTSLNMQDSYVSFTLGAQQLMSWCRSNMIQEGVTMIDISESLFNRTIAYHRQAFSSHEANLEEGVYESNLLDDVFSLWESLTESTTMNETLLINYAEHVTDVKYAEDFDLISLIGLTFMRLITRFNILHGSMSFSNINIVLELYTSMMAWFYKSNDTWDSFYQTIQVCVQKGNLVRPSNKNFDDSFICIEKPNSTGMDTIIVANFNNLLSCFQYVMSKHGIDRPIDLTMNRIAKETPGAMDRNGMASLRGHDKIDQPDPKTKYKPRAYTECRNMGDADYTSLILAIPRNGQTAGDNVKTTTDVVNGSRQRDVVRRWKVGGFHPLIFSSNTMVLKKEINEAVITLSLVCKMMSSGANRNGETEPEDRGDFMVTRASGALSKPTEEERKKNSALLCALPVLSGAFTGLMNYNGFIKVEIGQVAGDFLHYGIWRYNSLFSGFRSLRFEGSAQRCFDGHKARWVADASFKRLSLETLARKDLKKAFLATHYAAAVNALPVSQIIPYLDDSIREMQDAQSFIVHLILQRVFHVPILDLPWWYRLLSCGVRVMHSDEIDPQKNENAKKFMEWVDQMYYQNAFVTSHNGTGDYMGFLQTMPGNSGDFLTVKNIDYKEAFWEFGSKLASTDAAKEYNLNNGFLLSDKILAFGAKRYCEKMRLGLNTIFECKDLYNPAKLLQLRNEIAVALNRGIALLRFHETPRMESPGRQMGTILTRKEGEMSEHKLTIHGLSALCLSSLLGCRELNSNLDECISKRIIWMLCRDIPLQYLPSKGDKYIRKLYTATGSPQPAIAHLTGYSEERPQYLRRPHEQSKFDERFSSKLLPGPYLNYVNEDVVHNSEVVAHAKNFECNVQEVYFTNEVYHRYFLLDGVDYPCVERGGQQVNVICINGPNFYYRDLEGAFQDTAPRESLDEYLARNSRVLLPLIRRHNVLVRRSDDTFGIIVPRNSAETFSKIQYFENGVYHVYCNDGALVQMNALEIEKCTVRLNAILYLRMDVYHMLLSGNSAMASKLPSLQEYKNQRHCYITTTLWYPSQIPTTDPEFASIYLQLPIKLGDGKLKFFTFQVWMETLSMMADQIHPVIKFALPEHVVALKDHTI